MWWILPVILVIIFMSVITYRTLTFRPDQKGVEPTGIEIDPDHAIASLSEMIRIRTVSYSDESRIDEQEFARFRQYLVERYPEIHRIADRSMHGKGILYRIKGKRNDSPTVLMAHYDVVPVEGDWTHDPFGGRIEKGYVHGRGTLDTKNSLTAIMEAMEHTLKSGHVFVNDVYIALGGDEEVGGLSAQAIADHLDQNGVKPGLVLDEGGAIVSNVFPGVTDKVAVIGIAEKGFLNLKLTVRTKGGHASSPPKRQPLGELAQAINALDRHPSFRLKLTDPVKNLFETLAPHSESFAIRMIFSNLWAFLPVVKRIAKSTGGEFLSMFRTTQAFTLARGSDAINVLPTTATIGINYRLALFDHPDDVLDRIKRIIANDNIAIEVLEASEATPVSRLDEPYERLEKAIKSTWKDVLTTPYLMVATTDSRRYHRLSDHVYRFSPMDVSKDDLARIHGIDEAISTENVVRGVQFYVNLMKEL
ncbi:MAG: M20/M25/M40 family metallo-hydrolase [Acholeplasmataceae bacterium]